MTGVRRSPCSPLCHAFHNHSLYFHIPILAILGFFFLMFVRCPHEFYVSDYFRYFIYLFTGFGVVGSIFHITYVLHSGEVSAPVALSAPSAQARRVTTKQRNRVRPVRPPNALDRLALIVGLYRHLFEAYIFSAYVVLMSYLFNFWWAPMFIGINYEELSRVMAAHGALIPLSWYPYWYVSMYARLKKQETAENEKVKKQPLSRNKER